LLKIVVVCPEYIQIIMTLEESVQHVVMTAIQEVRGHSFYSDIFMCP